MKMLHFRKLNENDDIDMVASWIYSTDHFLFDLLFDNDRIRATTGITRLINSSYINPYHRKFITVIYDEDSPIKGVCVGFKGSEISSPTELLGSETNKKLFDSLKKTFDIIIIDSAPVNEGLSDSMLLSKLVDSVIIVGAFKSTSYKDLKATKEQLKNIKANILGIVLNKTVPKSSKYYGGYYGRNH